MNLWSISICLQQDVNIFSCPKQSVTVIAQNQLFFTSRLPFLFEVYTAFEAKLYTYIDNLNGLGINGKLRNKKIVQFGNMSKQTEHSEML